MAFAKQRAGYFTAHYAIEPSKYRPVLDDATGKPMRFPTKKKAEQAADYAEIEFQKSGGVHAAIQIVNTPAAPVDQTSVHASHPGDILFKDYVQKWFKRLDLALNTLNNYANYLDYHLKPKFDEYRMRDIDKDAVAEWESSERGKGHERSSIAAWRGLLSTILEDAWDEGLISSNPAKKKRGRGRRTRQAANDMTSETVVITLLDAILIGERMALLTGRDDEFVAMIVKRLTGIRAGELRGIEVDKWTPSKLLVHWQLAEIRGVFDRCIPKCGSVRDVDWPEFLSNMVADHIDRTAPTPCECHSRTFAFAGLPRRRSKKSPPGVTMAAVAVHAGVTERTVSVALGASGRVSEATREKVALAANELGYVAPAPGERIAHWSADSFRKWVYYPAVSGLYLPDKKHPSRPVPVTADPFPGIPIRGPRAAQRADGVWAAIADGMTPHGNRHSVRVDYDRYGTPKVLVDLRMGWIDPSMSARYAHVTQEMRDRLMEQQTEDWEKALDMRAAMGATSPVAVLDRCLQDRVKRRLVVAA
ncbi:LacI family DNA-binding transcriptional regulator [Nocardia brasiliensis]|uniref:LacI family DNA-binding transcriptional regulator n=1 Tax=Nocardia brasiliensis TaxID=37326 RepID=UPI0024539D7C|nr:LacI family DNA-binding transcriptional regulator [Nocardia brasiliensis]